MKNESKNLETVKSKSEVIEHPERTSDRTVYIPQASVFETEKEILIAADMPGVDDKNVEITLEKNELRIKGFVEDEKMEGYSLVYSEYGTGDYQRSFRVPNEIDRDKIEASIRDGVLKVTLPKADLPKTRVINVKAG